LTVGFEEGIVARLRALEAWVPEAWHPFLKRVARCLLGWLGVLPELLRCGVSLACSARRATLADAPITVVIVEPHLGSRPAVGHELPFSLTVARGLQEQGIEVSVLGHRRLDATVLGAFEARGIPCHRVFRHSGVGMVPAEETEGRGWMLGRFLAHALAYAADLTSGLARSGVGPARVLFFPTSALSCIVGSCLVRRLSRDGRHGESQVHVIHTPPQLGNHGGYACRLRRLVRARGATRLHLGTVNGQVNAWLRARGEPEALEIPIPLPADVLRRGPPHAAPRRIGFLGSAHPAKGFTRLPDLLPRLLRGHPSARIVVQVNPFREWPAVDEAADRLRRLAGECDRVELVEAPPAMDRYYQLLNGIDVVVLPYDPRIYAMSISSVGIEAMALGKVVVGPDVGWFADQQQAYGAYLAVDTDDTERLASGILAAVEDFDALVQRARRDAPKFHWHNVDTLVRLLLDVAARDGLEPRGRHAPDGPPARS
jgi:glycosyltransferase involved in cell wall biosynthesis